MAELISNQFAYINGLRFQFKWRQHFRREHVSDVCENGAKPRHPQTVAEREPDIKRAGSQLQWRQFFGRECIPQIAD